MSRRVAVPALILALVAAGCAVDELRRGPSIACDTDEPERLVLFAQAVPTASLVPCVTELPPGWEIREIETRTGEGVIHFSDDATDVESEAVLTAECEGLGATGGAADLRRGQGPGGADVFVFAGGCVMVSFEDEVGDGTSETLLGLIGFVGRAELEDRSGREL